MASTTFTDNQTVIYAAWLNDVNNAVYNGVFQSTTLTATNMVCNGTASGAGFTALVNNVFSAPNPIGSATPNTGAFTTLTATTPIAVSSGGTGSNTLTANNVLLGNGTSALQKVAPGTSGNALISNGTTWVSGTIKGLGLSGETWHDVSSTKTSGTTYTAPAYPIMVSVGTIQTNPYHGVLATVAGVTVLNTFAGSNNYQSAQNGSFIVPAGASYVVTITGTVGFWVELY